MKSDTCAWELLSDSLEHPEKRLPIEMEKLVDFMKERGSYRGGNSEFTASFNAFAGTNFTAKALKQQICRNVVKVTGENIIVKELKTAAGDRYVYFSLEMANLLKEYRSFCQGELELHEGRELTIEDYIFRRHGADLPMTPSTFTWRFKLILKKHGLPLDLNVHSLRHPYVKHTTKKFNSEKQKTQATKIVDLIAWVFCFCIVSYSKRSWTL